MERTKRAIGTRRKMGKLDELRREVDRIDAEIVRLLNERARQALLIGCEKQRNQAPIEDSLREEEVIARAQQANGGPLDNGSLAAIYRSIIRACAGVQRASRAE